ncbi:hypothetical protein OAL00_01225 [Verrucomicrobiales bacterium]|nr:hypothetical protein [Verrucomicrobiales bacterium]
MKNQAPKEGRLFKRPQCLEPKTPQVDKLSTLPGTNQQGDKLALPAV